MIIKKDTVLSLVDLMLMYLGRLSLAALLAVFGWLVQPISFGVAVVAYVAALIALALLMKYLPKKKHSRDPLYKWYGFVLVFTSFIAYDAGEHWFPLIWICVTGACAEVFRVIIWAIEACAQIKKMK